MLLLLQIYYEKTEYTQVIFSPLRALEWDEIVVFSPAPLEQDELLHPSTDEFLHPSSIVIRRQDGDKPAPGIQGLQV